LCNNCKMIITNKHVNNKKKSYAGVIVV
jgi:hypothetical protein